MGWTDPPPSQQVGREGVQCNFFIRHFPVPVSSWARDIDICKKDFHDIAHSQSGLQRKKKLYSGTSIPEVLV